jgi:hypothetical protein
MKFVLNRCYGGFALSDWALWKLNIDPHNIDWDDFPSRDDPELISLVEQYPDKVSGECAQLEVIEIPNYCTDWELNDYNGFESLTYVVCGKIYHE